MTLISGTFLHKILNTTKQIIHVNSRNQSLFRKSKTAEQLSPYIIVRATKDDHLNILKLMHDTYFTEEPTCYALGITRNPVLDERALSSMAEGMTMMARCKYSGSVVGACVNESTHCWDPDITEKLACSVRCPKVRQLMFFYAHLQRLPDVWKKYNVSKVFEMSMLFVHKGHRKRGLAYRLMTESRAMAADCGFKVVRCDATSAYTTKLCQKLQMQQIGEIPYSSYLSRNLEPVFMPPHPHDAVRIFIDINPQLKKSPIK